MIECADEITPYSEDGWLNILLRTGEGEYVVNAKGQGVLDTGTATSVCENRLQGNRFWVKIPFANLQGMGKTVALRVTDHVGDGILDVYVQGDSAPLGNLFYEYKIA